MIEREGELQIHTSPQLHLLFSRKILGSVAFSLLICLSSCALMYTARSLFFCLLKNMYIPLTFFSYRWISQKWTGISVFNRVSVRKIFLSSVRVSKLLFLSLLCTSFRFLSIFLNFVLSSQTIALEKNVPLPPQIREIDLTVSHSFDFFSKKRHSHCVSLSSPNKSNQSSLVMLSQSLSSLGKTKRGKDSENPSCQNP